MKNVASAYIERWNFVLGAIFVAIVIFMPDGLVPGSLRLWRWGVRRWRSRLVGPAAIAAVPPGSGTGERSMSALELSGLQKSFGGLRVTHEVNLSVEPGERRLIIGPNGAGKTTLFNLITGELRPDAGTIRLFEPRAHPRSQPPARASRPRPHLSDHHAVSTARRCCATSMLSLLGLSRPALESASAVSTDRRR